MHRLVPRISSAMISLRSTTALLAPLISIAALVYGSSADAATIVDDFSYSSGTLSTQGGGSGWTGTWGAGGSTSRILVDNTSNLSFDLGGYDVAQTGIGLATGNFNAFRGINRFIDVNLTGTIWFSILINNSGTDDHTGIQFNNHADTPFSGIDYEQGLFHAELAGTDLQIRYNGTTTTAASGFALNTTHLLLGRITLADGNDRLELWADPVDVLNPGTPLFNESSADMGANLFLAGVFAYGSSDIASTGGNHGKLDALRISDGGGDATQALNAVVGVPEPSSAILLLTGGLLFGTRRRSSRRWSIAR